MITKEQALTAREFHSAHYAKPGCMTWRRNGTTKTWKTRPNEFRVPVKFGLYTYNSITQADAHLFHVAEDCDNA
jgi:hypothetical protein